MTDVKTFSRINMAIKWSQVPDVDHWATGMKKAIEVEWREKWFETGGAKNRRSELVGGSSSTPPIISWEYFGFTH